MSATGAPNHVVGYMQDCTARRHILRSVRTVYERYTAAVAAEQQIIAGWMSAVLTRLGEKPYSWSRRAKLSPSTVTRAMSPNYTAITSVPTLVGLADAADLPTILDFLAAQSIGADMPLAARDVVFHVLNAAGCRCDGIEPEVLSRAIIDAVARVAKLAADVQREPNLVETIAANAVARARDG